MSSFGSTIRKYNVEPILFLYKIARYLYQPAVIQSLMIDKICVNDYHLDKDEFCYKINLPEIKNTTEAVHIQKDVVQYIMYQQLILSVPSMIAGIFLGPFLDRHPLACKMVILGNLFAGLFESGVILLNVFFFEANVGLILISHILNGIFGGALITMSAIFTIAMKSTPLEERTFRFTIIEFALVLPVPTSNFISSLILPLKPMFDYQIRNYVPILALATIVYSICILLTIFTISEIREVISPLDSIDKRLSIISTIQPVTNEYLNVMNKNNEEISLSYVNSAFENEITTDHNKNNFSDIDLKEDNKKLHNKANAKDGKILKSLFRLSNITDIIKSLTKRREHNAHKLLWSIVYMYIVNGICLDSVGLIMVPFVNSVYGMSTAVYMKIDSVGMLTISLVSVFFLIFLHKINLMDTKKIFIGLTSVLLVNLMRGSILSPIGLYLSYLFGSIMLTAFVSLRGLVSKVVPENELGTVLSILSCFYALCPILGTIFYGQIYRLSFNFYPGLAFLSGSVLVFSAILVNIYLHKSFLKYKNKLDKKLVNG